jgi:F0F1-type ATP synthase alpha subunit
MAENQEPVEGQSPEQQAQQGADKITKAFDASFKKLVALMGGDKNLKKASIPSNEVGDIVTELLKDRRKKKIDEFKTGAIALLDKKIEFDKEVRKAEEAFKNTVNAKKKEFTEEMNKLFQNLESINDIEKSYYSNLSGGSESAKG